MKTMDATGYKINFLFVDDDDYNNGDNNDDHHEHWTEHSLFVFELSEFKWVLIFKTRGLFVK